MQRNHFNLFGLGALILWGASGAWAQALAPGEGPPAPRGHRGAARVLGLTEEQQAAAREIFERQRPEREALRDEMRANREALRASIEGGGAEPCTVGEIVIEGHALREKARALGEESKRAFAGLLTEEQRKKLSTLEAARELLGPRGGPGMRRPRGDDPDPMGVGPGWE